MARGLTKKRLRTRGLTSSPRRSLRAIEQYLDDVDDELRVSLRRRERILSEIRAHLEQSVLEAQEQGAAPADASQRAIEAFGSAREVAKGFAGESQGVLNRTAITVSDFWFRVCRSPEALAGVAFLPLGGFLMAGIGADSVLYPFLCTVAGVYFFFGWRELRPVPRPGYVRRWRKLDAADRQQIIAALRDGRAVSVPPASAVGVEVRQRMRGLRSPLHLGLRLLIIIFAAVAVFAALASGELSINLVVVVVAHVVVATVFSRCDWRSVRRRVASELEALEVVEEVAGEALRHGGMRLQEQQAGSRLWFELAPENPHVCPVSLEVDTVSIRLWAGDRDCCLGSFDRADGEYLWQLSRRLDAMISAWPSTRRAAPSTGSEAMTASSSQAAPDLGQNEAEEPRA